MEKKNDLIITPKTKVLELIETFPLLEDVLIEYVAVFEKLKNPILRKTVAKITSLQQAAAIGGVKVEDLINRLRKEVGQELYSGKADKKYIIQKPDWFTEKNVIEGLNASDMLAAGEQPVNQVIADLNQLDTGKIYKLIAPFITAPIIDKATSLGLKYWVDKKSAEEFHIYFTK
jgi:hypothetical protein